MIRGFPNGETHLTFSRLRPFGAVDGDVYGYFWTEYIGSKERTRGTETSQYPEERKSTETPLVVASERGPGRAGHEGEPDGKPGRSG